MKGFSTCLVIREMEIKTTMRYHYVPIRMVVLKKKKKIITSVDEDVEKSEPSCIAGGNFKWSSCCGKQCGSSSKC